jgi:hypothetical protein
LGAAKGLFRFKFDDCARNCAREVFQALFLLLGSLLQILIVNDVVALENRSRFMTRDPHCHLFSNARTDHIPYRCPSQIVKQLPLDPTILEGFIPGKTKISDLSITSAVKENIRKDLLGHFPLFPEPFEYLNQL